MDNKNNTKNVGKMLFGGLFGFALWSLFSYPKSAVNKKWPEKKIKNLQVLPHIQYHSKDKTYHIHHWMYFTGLYLTILTLRRKMLKSKLLHGFFLGSIIQGLIYKDRFHVVKKLEELSAEE